MLFLSLCCSSKPATECSDLDAKYSAILDRRVEVDLSLCMVCDEEVVAVDSNSIHSITTPPAQKLDSSEKTKREIAGMNGKPSRTVIRKVEPVHLSRFELEGLSAVAEWLESLPVGKRNVPKDLPEPDVLLNDVQVSRISLFALDNIDIDGFVWIVFRVRAEGLLQLCLVG